ncbi:MAG: baseplate J/gp47 family protein [Methanocorpusculum sp.]|nr:baseplate J/gp47 family protein [Methanocorpusculum sp.]
MKPRTVREIQQSLLAEMHSGADATSGSYESGLTGAIAIQQADLERNLYLLKLWNHALATDVQTLGLQGRSVGIFERGATAAQLELFSPKHLDVGAVITASDTKQKFTVIEIVSKGAGEICYIESQATGADPTAVPHEWYTDFKFSRYVGSEEEEIVGGRIQHILVPGFDAETPDEFRARVYAAHQTRPFAGNPAFYKGHLTDEQSSGVRGVGCVRIRQSTFLTGTSHAVVDIYIGYHDLAPVTQYTLKKADAVVQETCPIGTQIRVQSVNRLDTPDTLKFDITYRSAKGNLRPEDHADTIVELLQSNFSNLAKNTFPLDPIILDIPQMEEKIGTALASYGSGFAVTATYKKKEHMDRFALDPQDVPWAVPENVSIHSANAAQEFIPDP